MFFIAYYVNAICCAGKRYRKYNIDSGTTISVCRPISSHQSPLLFADSQKCSCCGSVTNNSSKTRNGTSCNCIFGAFSCCSHSCKFSKGNRILVGSINKCSPLCYLAIKKYPKATTGLRPL